MHLAKSQPRSVPRRTRALLPKGLLRPVLQEKEGHWTAVSAGQVGRGDPGAPGAPSGCPRRAPHHAGPTPAPLPNHCLARCRGSHRSRAMAVPSNLRPRSLSCDSQRPHLLPVLSSTVCCAPRLLGAEGLGGQGGGDPPRKTPAGTLPGHW